MAYAMFEEQKQRQANGGGPAPMTQPLLDGQNSQGGRDRVNSERARLDAEEAVIA